MQHIWKELSDESYAGVDQSRKLLKIANKSHTVHIQTVAPKTNFVQAEPVTLPFKDDAFEFVLLRHILERQKDGYVKVMEEALRVASRGIIVDFFNRPLPKLFPDIFTISNGIPNNWYNREKFEQFVAQERKRISYGTSYLHIPTIGPSGQTTEVYFIKFQRQKDPVTRCIKNEG